MTSTIPMEEVPAYLHERIVMRLAYADTSSPVPAARPARAAFPRSWAWAACTVSAAAIMAGALNNRPQKDARVPLSIRAFDGPHAEPPATTAPTVTSRAPDQNVVQVDKPSGTAAEVDTTPEMPLELVQDAREPAVNPVTQEPVVRKLVPERFTSATPPAPTDRPQPVAVTTSGRPATDIRVSEPAVMPPVAMTKDGMMAIPGDPLVNAVGPVAPADSTMPIDKDPTRMAGMAVEVETPGEEDEGLRSFRMFLQENSRSVPQPPTVRPRERNGRKAL